MRRSTRECSPSTLALPWLCSGASMYIYTPLGGKVPYPIASELATFICHLCYSSYYRCLWKEGRALCKFLCLLLIFWWSVPMYMFGLLDAWMLQCLVVVLHRVPLAPPSQIWCFFPLRFVNYFLLFTWVLPGFEFWKEILELLFFFWVFWFRWNRIFTLAFFFFDFFLK